MRQLADINALSEAEFVAAFGDVAEHSPWVAEQAATHRPFADRAAMIAAFEQTLRAAGPEAQLALVRAHPDLATRARLTADSANEQKGVDPDDGVTMGLFSYPILMAADIVMFNAHKVPVGRDQVQHLEMARDIADRFNRLYGGDFFVLPEVQIEDEVATLPGLDGRKMSKSYNNTIPLFEGGAAALRAAIMRIVTDSKQPGEPKDAQGSHLYTLYRAFATAAESEAFRKQLEAGMGWGEAKQALYEKLEGEIAPMRERYDALIANPARLEEILMAGATKARKLATPAIERLREAVGLRNLNAGAVKKAAKTEKAAKGARFVSFREQDGSFRFRLMAAGGNELLTSIPYADAKQAGAVVKRLPADAALQAQGDGFVALLDGVTVAQSAAGATLEQAQAALAWLAQA